MMKTLCQNLWKLTKTSLIISLLLLGGQIPVGHRTVGAHLVHGIYEAVVWVGTSLKESEWFAKMSDGVKSTEVTPPAKVSAPPARVVPPPAPLERVPGPRIAAAPREMMGPKLESKVESEAITPSDRDSLMQLLEE
jgi:hypothetical protein